MTIQNRYEFVVLFDVENGNPNGDPDAGNMPRIDAETGHGIVTDVCLKRKIRNYVETVKGDAPGYSIYIQERVPLNAMDKKAFDYLGIVEEKIKEKKKDDPDIDRKIRDFMCQNFYDVRAFGAVMTTFVKAALNCGQVRGPVQLGFARSIEPVVQQEVTITRIAITTEADKEKKALKWDASMSFRTRCIALRALYPPTSHKRVRDFPRTIWRCFEKPLSTCSSTTVPPPGARWLSAS